MARIAPAFRLYDRDGYAWIEVRSLKGLARMRQALGVRFADSSGRGPSREATAAGIARYQDICRGRAQSRAHNVLTQMTLEELAKEWLESIRTPENSASVAVLGAYTRTWFRVFGGGTDSLSPMERIASAPGVTRYVSTRLREVLRVTLRKELSAIFSFLRWCIVMGHIEQLPARPLLPPRATGVRSGGQRSAPVDVTSDQVEAILSLLPKWSKARNGCGHRIRDLYAFAWETGLRPSTIGRLSVPENWSPGRTTITILARDDKARFARELPLTHAAMAILTECAPTKGVIFGKHDNRKTLRRAAEAVLSPEQAAQFSRYDFRHARINFLLEQTGNLHGVAYLAGHKQLTTTNAYLRSAQRHGTAVIAALEENTARAPILKPLAKVTIGTRAQQAPESLRKINQ